MISQRKITAISLFLSLLTLVATNIFAAGIVTHVSGPLAAVNSAGVSRAIAIGSKVAEGDTVITEKRTYARLKFDDGGEVTLKPGSQFRIDKYNFDQKNPQKDSATFNLVKGGLRTITGQIGKRGNKESYEMKTPTATIGIRGTIYDAHFCQGSSCGNIPPGLYVAVTNGTVVVTNFEGNRVSLPVMQGQFVYVQSTVSPPVILPSRPDIQFNPPPSVGSSPSTPPSGTGGQSGPAPGGSDCLVR